ncbi:MAG TPA: sigma-70 family RNA polymerase sigma factor [Fimbriimonadaceae bacterium]|nr:sigma-70 family RNA polymerase sigma factor [Fimbriimonadaceae bacterium]HRJ33571.1 sigma-70 family RNA polymerase sigma factor [Fimbriimonadaceae bacterium]
MKTLDWDRHLVERAQLGEKVAFELLVDQYRDAVQKHAHRILRDKEDALDAVQDTFLKAMRAIGRFQAGRPVLPWLLRICTNCCVDAIRARKQRPDSIEPIEMTLADDAATADTILEQRWLQEEVRSALDRLPSRYREILWMRHYRDMEVAEIAEVLKKPEGTIKSWLFRARALLKNDPAMPRLAS